MADAIVKRIKANQTPIEDRIALCTSLLGNDQLYFQRRVDFILDWINGLFKHGNSDA
jgi:hypothetical protein